MFSGTSVENGWAITTDPSGATLGAGRPVAGLRFWGESVAPSHVATQVRRVDLTRAYLTLPTSFPSHRGHHDAGMARKKSPTANPAIPSPNSTHPLILSLLNVLCPATPNSFGRVRRRSIFRSSAGPAASHKRPVCRRPGNQVVADWVCAGLDILGLVCVGVTASPCAAPGSVVSGA
jgi:hypothetical protein